MREARSIEVIDIIQELFGDKSYSLYNIFQSMFQNEADVDNLYDEITRAFKPVVTTVDELDQLGLLTNLSMWVREHPTEAIGVDSNINQLTLALNGRSIKNAILTAVKDAGPNACPPLVVGVGVGGTFEKCALLAKEALTREICYCRIIFAIYMHMPHIP